MTDFTESHDVTLPAGVTGPRPTQPRPEVLDAAAAALATRIGATTRPTWGIAERRERTRSTIFVLVARHEGGQTTAYYKAERLRGRDMEVSRREIHLTRRRQAIEGEQRLAPRLADAFEDDGIRFDQPLALRTDLLTGVRLAVPGQRLGRALWYSLPTRRRSGRQLFEAIGRASRIIEDVGRSLGTPAVANEYQGRLENDFARVGGVLSEQQRRGVADAFDRLVQDVDLTRCIVWTHGDLSPGNILVDQGRIGVIDFSWRPHLKYTDVVILLDRLRTQSLQSRPWTRQVADCVIRGHGIDTQSPEWLLARLHRLVRNVQRPELRVRAQALQDLPALISAS